jgi:TM2 domain-containing membrane protein YozV
MNDQPPPVSAQPKSDTRAMMRFEAEKKSEGVALFLCWVVGIFGGHRFYLGRSHAITMLVITLVSFPLCFVIIGFGGIAATWIWMIVDLFSVTKWTKEYNVGVMAKIHSGQI